MNTLDISASALAAQRIRMTAIAGNIANAHTTRDAHGRNIPYQRMQVLFAPGTPGSPEEPGVHVTAVQGEERPFRWVHDPNHPDAIKDPGNKWNGYVLMPRINIVQEMVDMMLASRAYEANLSAMEVSRMMNSTALRIIA